MGMVLGVVTAFVVTMCCHAFCIETTLAHVQLLDAAKEDVRARASKWVLQTAGLYGARAQSQTRSGGVFESKGEKMVRDILETSIFPGDSFAKVRPDWLKNPETGRNLELDCYNAKHRLAVEVNGVQHYKYSPAMHGPGVAGAEKFAAQKRRDATKRSLCAKRGVRLIVLHHKDTVDRDACELYLRSLLLK